MNFLDNAKIKDQFKKHEEQINNVFKWKYYSSLIAVLCCIIVALVPYLRIGENLLVDDYGFDFKYTREQRQKVEELFEKQEMETVKNLEALIEFVGEEGEITDEDIKEFGVSGVNQSFWKEVEKILEEDISSDIRERMVDNYFSIETFSIIAPSSSFVGIYYLIIEVVLLIAVIVEALKEIISYVKNDNSKAFLFYEAIFTGRLRLDFTGKTKKIKRAKATLFQCVVTAMICTFLFPIFFAILRFARIKIIWSVLFIILAFIVCLGVCAHTKKLEKDVKANILKDKHELSSEVVTSAPIQGATVVKTIEENKEIQKESNENNVIYCTNCGAKAEQNASFCSKCGNKIK